MKAFHFTIKYFFQDDEPLTNYIIDEKYFQANQQQTTEFVTTSSTHQSMNITTSKGYSSTPSSIPLPSFSPSLSLNDTLKYLEPYVYRAVLQLIARIQAMDITEGL